MSIDQQLRDLADEYKLPLAQLQFTAALIIGAQQLPKPTTKEKIRRAEKKLKEDPDDDEAWAELFNMRPWRRRIFNMRTREIFVVERFRYKGRQPDGRKNLAIIGLAELWEQYHGRVPLYNGAPALRFIITALGITGVMRIMDTETLRKRLERIR